MAFLYLKMTYDFNNTDMSPGAIADSLRAINCRHYSPHTSTPSLLARDYEKSAGIPYSFKSDKNTHKNAGKLIIFRHFYYLIIATIKYDNVLA